MVAVTAERVWTVREVAEHLKVHTNTVLRWLNSGQLRGYRIGGTKAGWRIHQPDLDRFIAERRSQSEPREQD